MSLIEDLGGYANSKGVLEAYKKNGWSISDVCKGFHQYFTIEDLEKAILQYRREHNIFEVGDKVVRLDVDNIFIYMVQKVTLDFTTVVRKKKPNAVKTWGMFLGNNEIRHATNEEIKAGHRL